MPGRRCNLETEMYIFSLGWNEGNRECSLKYLLHTHPGGRGKKANRKKKKHSIPFFFFLSGSLIISAMFRENARQKQNTVLTSIVQHLGFLQHKTKIYYK